MIWAFLREGIGPAMWTFAAGSALAAVMTGLQALWSGGLVPRPEAWLLLVILAVPASWGVVVPAAGGAGVVLALAKWCREGAWTGIRASGIGGRQLLLAVMLVGAFVSVIHVGMSVVVEPLVRRASHRQISTSASQIAIWPGTMVSFDSLTVQAERVDQDGAYQLFLASPDWVGTAESGRIVQTPGGPAIELRGGRLADPERAWTLSFQRWVKALPPPIPKRLELAERTNAELMEVALQTDQDGRDSSYERAVLYKRWLHPLATLWIPLAFLPLGAGRRPVLGLGAVAVGYLLVVRVGDHLSSVVGPLLSAGSAPLYVAVMGLLCWLSWRDR